MAGSLIKLQCGRFNGTAPGYYKHYSKKDCSRTNKKKFDVKDAAILGVGGLQEVTLSNHTKILSVALAPLHHHIPG
jgi:hypothetical protein